MVFHVTGALSVVFAGKSVKQVLRALAQHIDQHVQTTTVSHADHHFTTTFFTKTADQLFGHGNKGIAPFQGETLGTGEFGTQVFFQAFGGGQAVKKAHLVFIGVLGSAYHRLKPALDPAFFAGAGDVHIFCTHRAAIGFFQG